MPPAAIVILICALLLIWAGWRFVESARPGAALACLAAVSLAICAYAASEHRLHEWDERFHAVVAQNLLKHPLTPTLYDEPVRPYDYRDWTTNHVWLHKPPFSLWLIALSIKALGASEFAVRFPSVLFTAFGVVLTFLIARRLFDLRVAYVAAAFHAVNGFLVALASGRAPVDHVDAILVVLIEAAMLLVVLDAEHPRAGLQAGIGLLVGLGLLTKWYPALLPVAVWVGSARGRQWRSLLTGLAVILVTAAAVAGPWVWHILRSFPREAVWEFRYGLLHVTSEVEEQSGSAFYYIGSMPKFFGEIVYIPLLAAAVALLKHPDRRLVLGLWITLPYLIFSFAATKMPSYVMIAAPAIFIAESWFFWWAFHVDALARRPAVRIVVLALLAVLPMRYVLRPGGPFTISDRTAAWVVELKALKRDVTSDRTVVFNVPRPIEAMFYLNVPAYSGIPPAAEVTSLRSRGFTVLVYDRGSLTAWK